MYLAVVVNSVFYTGSLDCVGCVVPIFYILTDLGVGQGECGCMPSFTERVVLKFYMWISASGQDGEATILPSCLKQLKN